MRGRHLEQGGGSGFKKSALAAVLCCVCGGGGEVYPRRSSCLMAYMVSVIQESQEYEGAAWVAYDAAFRRQAAATGQQDWSKINTSLYTICFTGKTRRSQRCDSCLSAAHKTAECYALGEEDPDASIRAMESVLLALTQGGVPARRTRSADVCRLYNERRCNLKNCKYRHACRWCRGGHAGCDCRSSGRPEPGPIHHEAQEERLLPIRSDMEWMGRGKPTP